MPTTRRVLALATLAACTVASQIVPAPAGASATSSASTPVRVAAPRRLPVPVAGTAVYVVKTGDNLFRIAIKLKTPLADLLATNKLTATSSIFPGDQLVVPTSAKDSTLVTTATGSAVSVSVAKDGTTKVVGTPAAAPPTTTAVVVPSVAATPAASATTTPSPTTTAAAPTSREAKIATVIAFARAQIGKPYLFFRAGPDSFDCSGLTLASYKQVGISLIHHSGSQSRAGTAVDLTTDTIVAGDLVFTASSSSNGAIGHVGLAISSTQWIQAPNPGSTVHIGALPAAAKILAVRRMITD